MKILSNDYIIKKMAKTKYREYFEKMLADNKELFENFEFIHNQYGLDEEKYQEKLNEEGEKVLEVVREYERRLCSNTERGIYSKYSAALAEKFQNEVRSYFPNIDRIGLIVDYFSIKKINL